MKLEAVGSLVVIKIRMKVGPRHVPAGLILDRLEGALVSPVFNEVVEGL